MTATGLAKKGRTCEICGDTYDASWMKQRTCSLVCGSMIKGGTGATIDEPMTRERAWLKAVSRHGKGRDPEKRRISYLNKNHKRRVSSRASDLTASDIRVVLSSRAMCPLCKKRMTATDGPRKKHLDHIIPITMGGTHTLGNVRVICRTCNLTRPIDLSDVVDHQPTLWAIDNVAAQAASVLRAQRKQRSSRPSLRTTRAQGKRAANKLKADLAYLHRLHGMGWNEIVSRFQFASPGHAHNVVYGGDGRAYAPARTKPFIGQAPH